MGAIAVISAGATSTFNRRTFVLGAVSVATLMVSVASGREFVASIDAVDNAERMAGLLNGYKLGQA